MFRSGFYSACDKKRGKSKLTYPFSRTLKLKVFQTTELISAATSTAAAAEAAAITIAAAAAEAAAAATIFTRSHRLSFIHGHCAAVIICAIEFCDCKLSFGFSGHFHESETFATTAVAVNDDLR